MSEKDNTSKYIAQDFNGKISLLNVEDDDEEKLINGFICDDKYLIPQPWLGNIINPSILILGKNPGFKISGKVNDLTDNGIINESNDGENIISIRDVLIKNLDSSKKREYNSIEWILDKNNKSWLSHWWRDKFFCDRLGEAKNMNIGIFNYYPFYSSKANDLDKNYNSASAEKVQDIFENEENKKNIKAIIFMWKGAIDYWKKLDCISRILNCKDSNINIYIANCKDPFNPKLKGIVTYEEMKKFNEIDHSKDINKSFYLTHK